MVRYATGTHAARVSGLGFAVGERLSGWVAANKRVICNSDAKLDFVGLDGPALPFASCLSVPLVAADGLEGVVTLYALGTNAFADAHRRAVESVARPLAHLLRSLREMSEAERLASDGLAASLDGTDTLRPPAMTLRGRPGAAISLRLEPAGPFSDRQVALVKAGLRAREVAGDCARVCLDPPSGLLILVEGIGRRPRGNGRFARPGSFRRFPGYAGSRPGTNGWPGPCQRDRRGEASGASQLVRGCDARHRAGASAAAGRALRGSPAAAVRHGVERHP